MIFKQKTCKVSKIILSINGYDNEIDTIVKHLKPAQRTLVDLGEKTIGLPVSDYTRWQA